MNHIRKLLFVALGLGFGLLLAAAWPETARAQSGAEWLLSMTDKAPAAFNQRLSCAAVGQACLTPNDCCRGRCQRGVCTGSNPGLCAGEGDFCSADTDCCSMRCLGRCLRPDTR